MTSERIVYVYPDGSPTGETAPKLTAHTSDTRMHLAFSCYVINSHGMVLITKRAETKKVWPGFWTNSVCGHPAPGEDMVSAIERRLSHELGMKAINFSAMLPRYMYKTPPYKGIVENEFCPVYFAYSDDSPNPNPEEVSDCIWLRWSELLESVSGDNSAVWSWWCKDQLKQLQNSPAITDYLIAKR